MAGSYPQVAISRQPVVFPLILKAGSHKQGAISRHPVVVLLPVAA